MLIHRLTNLPGIPFQKTFGKRSNGLLLQQYFPVVYIGFSDTKGYLDLKMVQFSEYIMRTVEVEATEVCYLGWKTVVDIINI